MPPRPHRHRPRRGAAARPPPPAGTSARQATCPAKRGGAAVEVRGPTPERTPSAATPRRHRAAAAGRGAGARLAVGLDGVDRGAERQPDACLGRAGREHRQQVGAVEVPVGPAVARHDRRARAAPAPRAAPALVASSTASRRGSPAPPRRRAAPAPRAPRPRSARSGCPPPTSPERRRLLEDPHPRPALRQRDRRREAADPAPDHRDVPPFEPHPTSLPARHLTRDCGAGEPRSSRRSRPPLNPPAFCRTMAPKRRRSLR